MSTSSCFPQVSALFTWPERDDHGVRCSSLAMAVFLKTWWPSKLEMRHFVPMATVKITCLIISWLNGNMRGEKEGNQGGLVNSCVRKIDLNTTN